MFKQIIKDKKKILGFVWQDANGTTWYAFGKPSQSTYIAFECETVEAGEASIRQHYAQ